jgi:hypothetical protein
MEREGGKVLEGGKHGSTEGGVKGGVVVRHGRNEEEGGRRSRGRRSCVVVVYHDTCYLLEPAANTQLA